MKITIFTAVLFSLLLLSCSNEPSIQKYFVENSGKKDFIALDISPSIINIDKSKLTPEQQTALNSFEKMNVLIFKSNGKNETQYQSETQKVGDILKDETYQELMKIGSGKDGASVSFVGDENDIDEFIFFAKNKDNGFAVVRILGNDMNPNNIMNMIGILQIANVDMEQLKPLQGLLK
ncbi:MAG: DUF4252 domain-containing protein [Flavobacterium sp.]|jgi:hypothetical protein|uniref:DUF4252 domain-containing protein n=1 Tax=Flavobacterium sp. TaxID=239 RepID=UPI000CB340C8|nr:DUF4252 domain-containing protein [Flavobacterium sp.]MBA4134052.1 DUF4252 domain-containing protein [Flavobacterium sp.]PJE43739.1 MAG: DUF4252 domain-containing protein [Flavobacterium sp.] [Flavobacterium sp. FEMGT703F]